MKKLDQLKERYWEEVNEKVVFTDESGNQKTEDFSGKDFNQFESNVELFAGSLERSWGSKVTWSLFEDKEKA